MTDIARLQLRIESVEAELAAQRLDKLNRKSAGAEKATDGLASSFKRMLGPLTAAVSATAALGKVVSVQREFDVLNASLITATGSTENAAVAFEALQQFAATTPYDLAQVTESFTKLVNLGLTPSERALTSYGNTAAAMGKDMNQLIEAVADAATGEFERLKEFGIKASQNGDRVSLTFRGVKTEIGNNAAEIEKYLMALGENEFAGAMTERMNSLDGALSNLGDAWDQMFLNVSQSGIGDAIEEAVRMATGALEELTAMLASGELEGYIEAVFGKFSGYAQDVERTFDILSALYKEHFSQFEDEGASAVGFIADAFKNLPENIRAFIQIITVELAASVDSWIAAGQFAKEGFAAIFSDDTIAASMQRFHDRLQNIATAREGSLQDIMSEREAALKSYDDQIAAAKKLREEYDKKQDAKKDHKGDRLAGFKQGGDGTATGGVDKAAAAAAKKRAQEFASLKADLRTEEEAIAESYAKRRAIIEANTADGSSGRSDLLARLDKDHAAELKALEEKQNAGVLSLKASLMTEEEAIADSYAKRIAIINENKNLTTAGREAMEAAVAADRDKALAGLEEQRQREKDSLYNGLLTEQEMLTRAYEGKKKLILESEAVTEMERQDLLRRLKQQFDEETAASETKRLQTQLSNAESLFSGLAGLAKAYKGEQSGAYKALFAVSKAFAVAQAGLAIKTSIAKAMELGWPQGLAAAAQAAAQGASILSEINGANFSGAYDQGGRIPAGKIGIVGEYGPELVRGPSSVTGRVATERLMKETSGTAAPAAPPVVNVKNINVLDPTVVGDYLATDDGEQMIMNVVQRNQRSIGR